MKYRRLTKEQFQELHQEFINFLSTQSITAKEWASIKSKKPEVAEAEMDIFSDLIWEGVLKQVKYLENISQKHLYLFHIKDKSIALIGVKVDNNDLDLTTTEGFSWLRENLMDQRVEIFNAEKKFKEDKLKNIFDLIEKGAQITKGKLFKYFEQLIG